MKDSCPSLLPTLLYAPAAINNSSTETRVMMAGARRPAPGWCCGAGAGSVQSCRGGAVTHGEPWLSEQCNQCCILSKGLLSALLGAGMCPAGEAGTGCQWGPLLQLCLLSIPRLCWSLSIAPCPGLGQRGHPGCRLPSPFTGHLPQGLWLCPCRVT